MQSYVYRFIDVEESIIYVGKTKSLRTRMIQHFGSQGHLAEKCYREVSKIEYIEFNTYANASLYEVYYILKYNPRYNDLFKLSDDLTIELPERIWNLYDFDSEHEEDNPNHAIRIYDGDLLLYEFPRCRDKYDLVRKKLNLTSSFDDIKFCTPCTEGSKYKITCIGLKKLNNKWMSFRRPLYSLDDLY